MKAAPEAQMRLLDLAEADAVLDRLAHRRRGLPELAELAELTGRLEQVEQDLVVARTEVADGGREQRKAEADVDQVRTRIDRDQKRLDSGQVTSPRDLETLQHEVTSLHRRQDELEEIVLEVMERVEGAERRVTELGAEQERVAAQQADAERRRDAAFAELDKEAAEQQALRASLVTEIPDDLLKLYGRLREQHDGVGAAPLKRGQCGGCKVSLALADLNAIRAAAPDEVIRCEECRRILVRTPESGL